MGYIISLVIHFLCTAVTLLLALHSKWELCYFHVDQEAVYFPSVCHHGLASIPGIVKCT